MSQAETLKTAATAARALRRAGGGAILLALVVIVLGAFTRLADAGLGCPDWPGCYGFVTVPDAPDELMLAGQRYPDSPVEHAKAWAEMIHRYAAATLGLVILTLAALTWRRPALVRARRIYALAAVMVVIQGLFGMWTVTLKLWPQVVTAHLLGGLTTLSLLVLGYVRLREPVVMVPPEQVTRLRPFRPWIALALAVLVMQVFLGAWTSTNYAALACTDFPTCNGSWDEPLDLGEGFHLTQQVGPNYLGGALHQPARAAIHMTHRLGALVTLLVVGTVLWRLARTRLSRVEPAARLGLVLLCTQLLLGLANVLWLLPLSVAVAHNAVAALLVLTLVWLTDRIWTLKEIRL